MKKRNLLIALLATGLVLASCEDGNFDVNTSSVTYVNYDDSVLYTTVLSSGGKATYEGADPTKPATKDNSYKFTGWSDPVIDIANNKVYKAQFDTMATVTFKNYDGSFLYTTTIKQGQNAVYVGDTPTKPINNDLAYKFSGWDINLRNIQINCDATAKFTELNTYLVSFLNYDGTLLQSVRVAEGEAPIYNDDVPTKPNETSGVYQFSGWSPEITTVHSEQTYVAQFKFMSNAVRDEATIEYYFNSETNSYYASEFYKNGTYIDILESYDDGTNGKHAVTGAYISTYNGKINNQVENQIITIPSSVTKIYNSSSKGISEINVDPNNATFTSVDGVVFAKNMDTLVAYPSGLVGAYVIPNKTSTIESNSFYNSRVSSLTIPKNVMTINSFAFQGCNKTKEFIVDKDNTRYCSVDGVVFNKDKTSLMFYPGGCNYSEYKIPDGVTIIDYGAFYDASLLNYLVFDDALIEIKDSALNGISISSLNITKNVQIISPIALGRLTVAEFTVDSQNKYFKATDGILYSYDQKTLVSLPYNNKIIDFRIPDTVEILEKFSITSIYLRTINIPSSVTTIRSFAFNDCYKLTKVFIPITVTCLEQGVFTGWFMQGFTVYCEATKKPDGWDDAWNFTHRTVVWGATDSNV